jgi:predicted oxidoreductase
MTSNAPHILFGSGGGIIPNSSPDQVKSLFKHLKDLPVPIYGIDTAAVYPGGNSGASERILGEAGIGNSGFVLDTKVLRVPREKDAHTLTRDAILSSTNASLERLHVDKVRTIYAHAPDPVTPIAETVAAFGEVLKKGQAESVCFETLVDYSDNIRSGACRITHRSK